MSRVLIRRKRLPTIKILFALASQPIEVRAREMLLKKRRPRSTYAVVESLMTMGVVKNKRAPKHAHVYVRRLLM